MESDIVGVPWIMVSWRDGIRLSNAGSLGGETMLSRVTVFLKLSMVKL